MPINRIGAVRGGREDDAVFGNFGVDLMRLWRDFCDFQSDFGNFDAVFAISTVFSRFR